MINILVTVLLLLSFTTAFAFAEGACDDHGAQTTTHQHCSIVCSICFQAVESPSSDLKRYQPIDLFVSFSQQFTYNNPTLDLLKRPPINIS